MSAAPKAIQIDPAPGARAISSVKFAEHGRVGDSKKPIREVYANAKDAQDKRAHKLSDHDPRGIFIDGNVLVPYANILCVVYE